jgi:hypothetical protein
MRHPPAGADLAEGRLPFDAVRTILYICTAGVQTLMRFVWDEKKAKSNKAKHGVSFELARLVFDDPCAVSVPDDCETRSDGGPWDWSKEFCSWCDPYRGGPRQ